MSVIVKGMEIPESCGRCNFNVSSLYCNRTGSEIDRDYEYRGRLSDCPISALPEKHGRLVDADELKTAFPRCDNNMDVKIASVRATINHMNTIVEAENSECEKN